MLATTFSKPQVMELIMPVTPDKDTEEVQEQAVKESQAMTIILGEQDQIYWYVGITDPVLRQSSFSNNEIRDILAKQHAQRKEMVLLIKPMSASRYENLIDLLDEVNNLGIDRYALSAINDMDLTLIESQN